MQALACQVRPKQAQLPSLPSFLAPLGGPDAGAMLSMAQKQGDLLPGAPLQKQISDAFNEGEAAEWLLRLG